MSEPVFDRQLVIEAKDTLDALRSNSLKLVTAESCTGGLIAALLTEIAGSSDVLERGFVTYSNEAKSELLGVEDAVLHEHGAVSEQVARQMAEGALKRSRADIAVSVTGIAGPGGGTVDKPVGLVHFGCARNVDDIHHVRMEFGRDKSRSDIRLLSVGIALAMVRQAVTPSAGNIVA